MTRDARRGALPSQVTLRRLPHGVWLVGVWVALWGELSLANVVNGVFIAALITLWFGHVGPHPVGQFRPWSALRYVGRFAVMLVRSTVQVAVKVISSQPVAPGIVAIGMRGASDAVVTLVANSVTLTPGTLTLETTRQEDEVTLYVHALDAKEPEDVRAAILRLEELAVAAFGHAEVRGRPSPVAGPVSAPTSDASGEG